ncbi:BTAD domain-containing putative transcriptional regulator [Streptosporangium sp. NPDC000396]|uniref:AfsR/SARP family transcriptional regulator n=1 Tax=Streptosporangium sp. NPDC000396 TaxID=3366185 RepID=UPI0036C6FFE9
MEIRLLGPLEVRDQRGVLVPVTSAKQRVVLAALALQARQVVSVEELVDCLWDDRPPVTARETLHSHVMRLRKALSATGQVPLATRTPGYVLDIAPDAVDVHQVRALRTRAAQAAGERNLAEVAALLGEAFTRWRGSPLADVDSVMLRARHVQAWEDIRLQTLEDRIDADLALGRHTELLGELRSLVACHPLREHFRGQLMIALVACGQRAEALREYQDARGTLVEELGIEPGSYLRRIQRQILNAVTGDDALTGAEGSVPSHGTATRPPIRSEEVVPDASVDAGERPQTAACEDSGRVVPAPAAEAAPTSGQVAARAVPAPVMGTAPTARVVPAPGVGSGPAGGPAVGTGSAPIAGQVAALLPLDVYGFTGRAGELERLDGLLTAAGRQPTAVLVAVLSGTAGVGKSALAVHWAHRVRDRFPDGQLYVNLRGFDPGGTAMTPTEAVRAFLDALGVPATQIPATPQAQAGLYRSLLAGRRILIVADNARDAAQVRPLLPGAPGCLVVVTSRDQLTGLVAVEGAQALALDLLPAAEARELLARRLGSARVAVEPEATGQIIARCARLPLALAVVAARAAAHPHFPLAALAAELGAAHGGLDALDGGDPSTQVRAVFSCSYQALDPAAAQLFRWLGLHPGPDLTAPAAASLAGIPLARTRPLLAELARAHLITEHAPGRYAFHDLMRAYATELAHAQDSAPDRRAALHRLFDHYLHTAHAAALLLNPHRDPIVVTPPELGVTVNQPVGHERAMAWLTAEHVILAAVVAQAAEAGFNTHAWQLAWSLTDFLDRRGLWPDQVAVHETALQAARRAGDRTGQAHTHRYLGWAHSRLGRHDVAPAHFRSALDLYGELGDPIGQASTHGNLCVALSHQGHHRDALDHAERALELYQAAGHRAGQARALNAVGWHHTLLGDHHRALLYCARALAILEELGDHQEQAHTWDSLGYAHHRLGRHRQAMTCYQRALELFRRASHRYNEAETLIHLGDIHHVIQEPEAARHSWRHALDILDQLGHPDADQVRAKLDRPVSQKVLTNAPVRAQASACGAGR